MQIVRIGAGGSDQPPAEEIGGKAANLARMTALGLPVPPAFVLPVDLCAAIVAGDGNAQRQLAAGLREGITFLEGATGCLFGDRRNPLLVSVRSGAARSMPGMLDTVVDVGCTADAVHGLVRASGHPRFAWDCRCRFLKSYATVVLGLDAAPFDDRLASLLAAEQAGAEPALDGEALQRLAAGYRQIIDDEDRLVPDTPLGQLEGAARAVYRSWMSPRARTYRELQHLDDLKGTAVTVQAMVYGNRNLRSGAGVAFSRDPSTGAAHPVIDVLFAAQGEDIVSGDRTPDTEAALDRALPPVAQQLRDTLARLEHEFGDVQDVEFTIEDGRLWILQTRAAKRTPLAALRLAIDFVREGRITPAEGLRRLQGLPLDRLSHRRLTIGQDPIACGIGAAAGVATGRAAFDSESAARLAAGDPVILVRPDTSTADVAGFGVSAGIITAVGGRTAHAALVARQMDKPCIVGCAALSVHVAARRAQLAGIAINEGDWLSIDGESGAIYRGRGEIVTDSAVSELREIEGWRSKVA